jgi:hypothetical protein
MKDFYVNKENRSFKKILTKFFPKDEGESLCIYSSHSEMIKFCIKKRSIHEKTPESLNVLMLIFFCELASVDGCFSSQENEFIVEKWIKKKVGISDYRLCCDLIVNAKKILESEKRTVGYDYLGYIKTDRIFINELFNFLLELIPEDDQINPDEKYLYNQYFNFFKKELEDPYEKHTLKKVTFKDFGFKLPKQYDRMSLKQPKPDEIILSKDPLTLTNRDFINTSGYKSYLKPIKPKDNYYLAKMRFKVKTASVLILRLTLKLHRPSEHSQSPVKIKLQPIELKAKNSNFCDMLKRYTNVTYLRNELLKLDAEETSV